MRLKVFCVVCMVSLFAFCETDYDMLVDLQRAFDSDLSDEMVDIAIDEVEAMKEQLSYIAANPINVNIATRDELEALPFLNVTQVENLLEYIFDYGELKSIYELALIKGWDKSTLMMAVPFLTVKPVNKEHKFSFKDIGKYGKSSIYVRAGGTLQKRKGYENGKYLGKPYSLITKFYFKHKDFSVGLLGSKSEGEPFDFKYNKGFDFYSGHIAFMNISKHFKGIYLGDYRVQFGQGLVFKSNSSFSSSAFYNSIIYSDNIKPSYSTSETGYFRGLALSFGGKSFNFNLMTSHTQYNKNEGYHRTESDFEKRYMTPSYMLGGNFSFFGRYYKIGFTGYYDFFDKAFNVGIDYRFRVKFFNFAGEVAMDRNLKFATINSMSVFCNDKVSLTALFRYYPFGFETKFGNAYSRNSVTDETGFAIGVETSPFRNWKFSFLSDIFNISLPKYNVNKPSVGFSFNFKALYSPSENNNGLFKYNVVSREKNFNSDASVKQTGTYFKHSFSLNYNLIVKERITLKSTLSSSVYVFDSIPDNKLVTYGYMLSFAGGWRCFNNIFSFMTGAAFFDIPEYDNRIYNYEPSLLYSYASEQYYGIGCRFFLVLKFLPLKGFNIEFKVADTYFVDRNVIGSGNDEIKGNHKTQLQGVVRYNF